MSSPGSNAHIVIRSIGGRFVIGKVFIGNVIMDNIFIRKIMIAKIIIGKIFIGRVVGKILVRKFDMDTSSGELDYTMTRVWN